MSLRLRITAGALVVVAALLCGAGLLVVDAVQSEMTKQVDSSLTADADFTQRMMTSGSGLPMGQGPTDLYVQFLGEDGHVGAASTAAQGLPPLARPDSSTTPSITA